VRGAVEKQLTLPLNVAKMYSSWLGLHLQSHKNASRQAHVQLAKY
jgi:hypothetical protein